MKSYIHSTHCLALRAWAVKTGAIRWRCQLPLRGGRELPRGVVHAVRLDTIQANERDSARPVPNPNHEGHLPHAAVHGTPIGAQPVVPQVPAAVITGALAPADTPPGRSTPETVGVRSTGVSEAHIPGPALAGNAQADGARLRATAPSTLLQDMEAKLGADLGTIAVTILFAVGFISLEFGVNDLIEHYWGDSLLSDIICVSVGLVVVFWVRLSKVKLMRFDRWR